MHLLLFLIFPVITVNAQQEPPNFRSKPKYPAETPVAKSATHVLQLPGLLANRQTKRVEIRVESTGVSGGDSCEYLVVGPGSSHGYEALFWSQAKPSDVQKALVFIGLEAGAPFAPDKLRFWGKGPRVYAHLADGTRLESLLVDRRSGDTLPEDGFIFTGSLGNSADRHDARAIIPSFNQSAAVLDLPRRASQGDVYHSQVVNADTAWPAHELATLVLQPDKSHGVKDLFLDITPDAFQLRDSKGRVLNAEPTFGAVLNSCYELIAAGDRPYVGLRFDGSLPLSQVKELAAMLAQIDVDHAIRIEPPAERQLYYRAFLPDSKWRNPATRIKQPWELHISANSATLVRREVTWKKGEPKPEIRTQDFAVADGEALRARLRAADLALPSVLLVFAPQGMRYGDLLPYIIPVKDRYPRIHVFLE